MSRILNKKVKKNYWNDPIMAAKRIAYKDVYIPENLRGNIEIYIKKNGAVAIRNINKTKKITGKDLRKLGFKKQVEKPTLDPEDIGFHYYTYEINNHCLLISCANDEKINDGYTVEIYEIDDLKFCDLEQLKQLMKLLKSAKK